MNKKLRIVVLTLCIVLSCCIGGLAVLRPRIVVSKGSQIPAGSVPVQLVEENLVTFEIRITLKVIDAQGNKITGVPAEILLEDVAILEGETDVHGELDTGWQEFSAPRFPEWVNVNILSPEVCGGKDEVVQEGSHFKVTFIVTEWCSSGEYNG